MQEHIYKGEQDLTGTFIVMADGEKNLRMRVVGDLAQYVFFENGEQVLETHASGGIEVNYIMRLPPELRPGEYRTEIIVSQYLTPEELIVSGGSTALAAIAYVMNVRVPNDGKFLEAFLGHSPARIQPGDVVFFTIPLLNFGTDTVTDISTTIVITDPQGNEIAQRPTTRMPGLNRGESGELKAYWDTEGMSSGIYDASARIEYGGRAPAQLTDTLRIGEIKIDILQVRTELSSAIGKIFIDIQSNWNDPIGNVYAEIDIRKGDVLVETLKTSSITLGEWGNATLTAFWEREGLELGEYEMDIRVYYYDKQEGKQVQVTLDEIAKESPLSENTLLLVAIILLALLVLLNAAWFILRASKGKKRR